MKISITGIRSINNRTLADLDIEYNDLVYKWQAYVNGVSAAEWDAYIQSRSAIIQADIDAKEALWAASPKTKTITGMFGEEETYPMSKDEIVKPDIPDYYDKRLLEYPSLADYVDAKAKQTSSDPSIVASGVTEEQRYLAACLAVKEKYPKV
jgi:hypothetical protein